MSQTKTLFVVRIKNNMKTEFDHQRYRLVCFCDLESKAEYRLATNLAELTNEVSDSPTIKTWQKSDRL